jgi:hypothetical protein
MHAYISRVASVERARAYVRCLADTKECARENMASAAVAVPVRVVSSRNASRRGCAENPGGWIS